MKRLSRRVMIALLAAALLWMAAAPVAYAAAPPVSDRESIDLDSVHYKNNYLNSSINCSNASSTVPSSPAGPVYFLGDSIGTQIQSNLQSAFGVDGWSYQGSALSGRTLAQGTVTPNGLAQIDADAAYIRTAKVAILQLGTNAVGFTPENVAQAIDKIKGLSPSATIYWVDTAAVGRDSEADTWNNVNKIINEQSAAKSFNVLSWNKTVFGPSADPENMAGQQDVNGFIDTADGLNVHLSDLGITAMSDLIVNTVKGNNPTSVSGNCVCGGVTNLSGSNNKEKIWLFFIGKGLTPPQAAGILGNMQAEAGFRPRLVEYGWLNSRGETSQPGEESSFDDQVPPDQNEKGQPGYGIVQFTYPPFKQALRERDQALGGAPANGTDDEKDNYWLSIQLEYLWEILNGDFKESVLDPIRATTSSDESSDIFLTKFERPGGIAAQIPIRRNNAQTILAELGSVTAPTSGGASESGCVGAGGGLNLVTGDTTDIPCTAGEDVTPAGGAEGYDDGKLYLIRICLVHPGTIVNSQVSKQVFDMINDANAAGVALSAQGAFRSMEAQIAIYQSWCDANDIAGSPPPYPKPPGETIRCPGGGAPGYSNHQMGFAMDMECNGSLIPKSFPDPGENECFDWLLANALRYGFFEYGKGKPSSRQSGGYEAWHWSVDGN